MNKLYLSLILIALLSSCIPDSVREKMDEGMKFGQEMLADQEFKKAIALIELHKLRNGSYPNSLSELEYLSAMDSSMFNSVQYVRHDSGYELNLTLEFPSFNGNGITKVDLDYPPGFWEGLGCVKSNIK